MVVDAAAAAAAAAAVVVEAAVIVPTRALAMPGLLVSRINSSRIR